MGFRKRKSRRTGRENPAHCGGGSYESAHRCLSGRRLSDGFNALKDKGHLELTLEAIAIDKRYTGLFSDEEANEALTRLLEAGYKF